MPEPKIAVAELALIRVHKECWASELEELHCLHHNEPFSLVSKCGGCVWLRPLGAPGDEHTYHDISIPSYEKVQPLRLVRKEDAHAK